MMKRTLVVLCLILCPALALAQQPGRPRRVSTKPANPCNERDFIQAVDTKITSLCQNAQWADIATGSTGANAALSNLASVAINTTLLPGAAGTVTLGSTSLPFVNLWLGASGSARTRILSASTGARTFTLPDETGTACTTGSICTGYQASSTAITGTGSINFLPKFTAARVIGDSQIADDGTAVAIATATGKNVTIGGGDTSGIGVSGSTVTIGDVAGNSNSSTLTVDDNLQTVTITNADLVLSGPLGAAYGGTGQSSSAWTGIPKVTAGVWSTTASVGSVISCPVNNATHATGTNYFSPGTSSLAATSEFNVGWIIPRDGVLKNLYVRTGGTAKTNTPATQIVVRINGSSTSLTVAAMTQTINTTSSDTAHTVPVSAGDVLTFFITTTGAGAVSTSISGISFVLDYN